MREAELCPNCSYTLRFVDEGTDDSATYVCRNCGRKVDIYAEPV